MSQLLLPLTLINLCAFACFALSSFGIYREWFGRAPGTRTSLILKLSGALLLFASALLSANHQHWGLGILLWLGNLTMTALFIALLQSLKELRGQTQKRRQQSR
ncbi:hypothetical protein NFHSH190041_26670 [Shewanella sp. NFH-SH190041]|uniref:DUF3325 domain-containing protein n=1 Tax=Shewanella sp. NFH-SH190041 TaxID=2950245 RepID=UPI0021C43E71|nr:DUF3325 domain-containing protein [Shewanella sp. NFH-SH190041]BDM65215.1 hypothetical protein NFHSH190041_26670 [Shewanella sp. NFH-SH190041]